MKINKISPQSNNFLKIIENIDKKPERLYFIGKFPTDRPPVIAIVGSRKPTSYGKEITYRFAYDLAKRGIIIISGLALGIDSIAHRAAIDAGGITIAILASGLDKIYPASNKQLANLIIEKGGAIVSEYEPGVEPRDYRFLERNRIVSGLSDAVLVTEAAVRSGTLSTVSHALNQGKEIFAVPGNITSPLSVGCNNLIKQGATLVTSYEDIIENAYPQLEIPTINLPLGNNRIQEKIIQLIESGIRDGDELKSLIDCEIGDFLQNMTEMEILGIIKPIGGNRWILK
ncbi:MAG: DNA-processing protein DprA [Candidatus Saccharimonadales bacterium]